MDKEENYNKIKVTEEFRGSLYSKILDHDSAYDTIYRWEKKMDSLANDGSADNAIEGNGEFQVLADGKDIGGFYQEEKLKEKDKYAYFFGGNYGEVVITNQGSTSNGNVHQGKKLLVVKDSFANTFVPLIADQYDRIYMVDFRYFNQRMKAYMEEKEITNQDLTDESACVVVKESFGNAFVPFLVDHYQHIYVVDYRYWNGDFKKLVKDKKAKDVILLNNLSMIRNQYLVGQFQGVIK